MLVTSHGGNVAAMELVARDLRARLGMLAVTVGWHRFGYPDGAFSRDEKKHGIHGGDIETSLMLAAKPDTVRMAEAPKATPATVAMAREFKWLGAYRPAGFAWMTQDLHPSGAVGDATWRRPQRATRRCDAAPRRSSNCCARSTASILRVCATGRSISRSGPFRFDFQTAQRRSILAVPPRSLSPRAGRGLG